MILVLLSRVFRKIRVTKAWGLSAVACLLLVAVLGNSICFYLFEHAADAKCEVTLEDSLWYSVISITTIGYGDFYATTTASRVSTVFFVVFIGLTAFSLFFGLLIDWFTELALRGDRGMKQIHASNHILIVNFPSESRIRQLIRELQSDNKHQEIVIVTDQIEALPFHSERVMFVRGSTVSEATYRMAAIENASHAIVLATSYHDSNSDAIVASAAAVIDHLKPEIHLVAECLDDEHLMLFNSVNTDAVVSAMRITGNLLVQESRDPGISQVFDIVTSNLMGDTIFSTTVGSSGKTTYGTMAKNLLDRDVNVLAITRKKETFTTFADISLQQDDNIVYLAQERKSWEQLESLSNLG